MLFNDGSPGNLLDDLALLASQGKEKGAVLDIVYSPPSFLWQYTRWFR
jgi:hypothetical protein